MGTRLSSLFRRCWCSIRELSGDDAYERYLVHHAVHHGKTPPLSRADYFRQREQEKWNSVRRCC